MHSYLSHIHLSLVHEVEYREQLLVFDALEVEEGMLVRIPTKDVPEERTASREDDFVSLHLGIITGKGDIKEVLLLTEFSESNADVGLEVIPPQAELLRGHLGTLTEFHLKVDNSRGFFYILMVVFWF